MKVLAGNWKMFKTRAQTRAFFAEVGTQLSGSSVRKIVCASPTLLETAVCAAQNSGIEIWAQNCAYALEGAYTGEVSPAQLADLGVKGSLVGHSERRQHFGDTDESVLKRARAALSAKLDVIYCIGESLREREHGQTEAVIKRQLAGLRSELLPHVGREGQLIVAYEPVWAIGTGVNASTQQVKEAHALIAQLMESAGKSLPLLYGGSVKPENFRELSAVPHVNGGLVGGASLKSSDYVALHGCLS